MIPGRRRIQTPPATAAFVAATALVAFASKPVEAGCSSLVHADGQPRTRTLATPVDLAGVEDAAGGGTDAPIPPRVPSCSGPSCSDRPGSLPAPATAPPDLGRDLWSDVVAGLLCDRTTGPVDADGPPRRPPIYPADVERPPRRSAA